MDGGKTMNSMLDDVRKQLDIAFQYAEIDEESRVRLQSPALTIEASLPLRHDDGNLKVYKAWRCQYSPMGIGKGGIRFSTDVSADEVQALAFLMHFKVNALLKGSPLSGSKGGIQVNPKSLSHRELERLSKTYIDSFHNYIGEDIDVPAPDLGTDETVMGWMYSRYREIHGGNPRAVITGKPLVLGGIQGRRQATGSGAYFVLENIIENYNKKFKLPQKNAKIAIHGFGNVGSNFAEICYRNGLKVVAISDINGGIFNSKGLNVPACLESYYETGEFEGGDKITNEELLQLDKIHILAPAATQNVINKSNCDKIKAPLILELANAPITSEADKILQDKGISVIPDLIANAGGVVVSYYEWLQNRNGIIKDLDQVQNDLKSAMVYACDKMIDLQSYYQISYRTAAYVLALKRIGATIECLGTKSYFQK